MSRRPGSKNKAVIQRELIAAEIAARTVADARTTGKKLAKEVLEDFMLLFAGMAASAQPLKPEELANLTPEQRLKRKPDEPTFEKWARLAVDTAAQLAKYQSPTFRAEHIVLDQVGTPIGAIEHRGAQVIDLATDVVALQARYQRMIKAVG